MRALRTDGSSITFDSGAPDPAPAPGEALVRTLRAGISQADLDAARPESLFRGILGHEHVGIVESVNTAHPDHRAWINKRIVASPVVVCSRCDLCRAGLSAHCRQRAVIGLIGRDGCLAERFCIPISNLVEVPKAIDDAGAALAWPLAAALHAARLVKLEGKPYISVLGDSLSGLLAAQVMSRLNASVRLLGYTEARMAVCDRWGVKHRPAAEVGRRHDQDVVIDTEGSPASFELAAGLARPRATIILAARSMRPVPANDLAAVMHDELTILGAGDGPIHDAITAILDKRVDLAGLITQRAKLSAGAALLAAAREPHQIRLHVEP